MRANPVKKTLKEGRPSVGTWLSLGSITAARFMARAGFDWLTVDIEHSLVGIETATHMFASIADAGCMPLARVPANRHDHIKRVLDNGAFGIVVPMVNSRQEALDAVAATKYPPVGNRSVGGSVHGLNFRGRPTITTPTPTTSCWSSCSASTSRRSNADEIFSVPGIDAIFVGPNDLAASMRGPDGRPPSEAETAKAMKHILATCKKYKVAAGVHCFSAAEVVQRIEEGWQFLAINSELKMMMDGATAILDAVGIRKKGDLAKY